MATARTRKADNRPEEGIIKRLYHQFRHSLEWLLCLGALAACAGGANNSVNPGSMDMGHSPGAPPSTQINAAEKYEGGFPAPMADMGDCFTDKKYCTGYVKLQTLCRFENLNYRMNLSGFVQPKGEGSLDDLNGRALRVVDENLNQFVDTLLSREGGLDEFGVMKKVHIKFETTLVTVKPIKLKLYLLPAGTTGQPAGEANACADTLCPPPQANLLTEIGNEEKTSLDQTTAGIHVLPYGSPITLKSNYSDALRANFANLNEVVANPAIIPPCEEDGN